MGDRRVPAFLVNAWFMDGSTTSGQNMLWKAAACRPRDEMVIVEQRTAKSAQHAEEVTVMLAAKQSLKRYYKSKRYYICSLNHGMATWRGKWEVSN